MEIKKIKECLVPLIDMGHKEFMLICDTKFLWKIAQYSDTITAQIECSLESNRNKIYANIFKEPKCVWAIEGVEVYVFVNELCETPEIFFKVEKEMDILGDYMKKIGSKEVVVFCERDFMFKKIFNMTTCITQSSGHDLEMEEKYRLLFNKKECAKLGDEESGEWFVFFNESVSPHEVFLKIKQ